MKWEYKVVISHDLYLGDDRAAAELNTYGDDGWELIDVRPHRSYVDAFQLVFKRTVMTELSVMPFTYEDAMHAVDGQ